MYLNVQRSQTTANSKSQMLTIGSKRARKSKRKRRRSRKKSRRRSSKASKKFTMDKMYANAKSKMALKVKKFFRYGHSLSKIAKLSLKFTDKTKASKKRKPTTKFWKVRVNGRETVVHYGRKGEDGSKIRKAHSSEAA